MSFFATCISHLRPRNLNGVRESCLASYLFLVQFLSSSSMWQTISCGCLVLVMCWWCSWKWAALLSVFWSRNLFFDYFPPAEVFLRSVWFEGRFFFFCSSRSTCIVSVLLVVTLQKALQLYLYTCCQIPFWFPNKSSIQTYMRSSIPTNIYYYLDVLLLT